MTLKEILSVVSYAAGVSEEDLKSSSRVAEIKTARQVFMYIARKDFDYKFKPIGRFVNRDHSTVMHACKYLDPVIKGRVKDAPTLIVYTRAKGVIRIGKHSMDMSDNDFLFSSVEEARKKAMYYVNLWRRLDDKKSTILYDTKPRIGNIVQLDPNTGEEVWRYETLAQACLAIGASRYQKDRLKHFLSKDTKNKNGTDKKVANYRWKLDNSAKDMTINDFIKIVNREDESYAEVV